MRACSVRAASSECLVNRCQRILGAVQFRALLAGFERQIRETLRNCVAMDAGQFRDFYNRQLHFTFCLVVNAVMLPLARSIHLEKDDR